MKGERQKGQRPWRPALAAAISKGAAQLGHVKRKIMALPKGPSRRDVPLGSLARTLRDHLQKKMAVLRSDACEPP